MRWQKHLPKTNRYFVDIEYIYFNKQDNTDYPYEKSRPYEEIVSLLANIVNGENNFVLASVTGGFEDESISHLVCDILNNTSRQNPMFHLGEAQTSTKVACCRCL